MTRRNWIVVANAARARIIELGDVEGVCRQIADLVHPASRLKGVEQAALHGGDRPGRVAGIGHGAGNATYWPHTDPRHREQERFAREVATYVDQGTAEGRIASLILVASDPFLGRLKASLGAQSQKLVLRTVASDFTTLRDADILRRLAEGSEPR
jgi:protein required for attachment to host cells